MLNIKTQLGILRTNFVIVRQIGMPQAAAVRMKDVFGLAAVRRYRHGAAREYYERCDGGAENAFQSGRAGGKVSRAFCFYLDKEGKMMYH